MSAESEEAVEVFITARGSAGRGWFDGSGLVVAAGSSGKRSVTPTYSALNIQRRAQLIEEGALIEEGDLLRFTRDVPFDSPSAAGNVVCGRRVSGWLQWRTADGQPISRLRPASSAIDAEAEFRMRWYEAHAIRFDDAPTAGHALSRQDDFTSSASEALDILERLRTHRSIEQFVEELREWSVKKSTLDFNGFNGQMFVNQLVNRSDDQAALADVLADVLTVPSDDDEIALKITRLVDYIEPIRVGAHPAPSRTPFLLSYFWALADHESFPTMWPNGANFVQYLIGESLPDDQAQRYVTFREIVRSLDDDNVRFECVAGFWEEQHPVFLDPVLCERVEYGIQLAESDPSSDEAGDNAAALVSAGRHIGAHLNEAVSSALGRSTTAKAPPRKWRDGEPRADTYADWVADSSGGLGIRVWVSPQGASIAVRPGWYRNGWYEEAERVIQEHPIDGFQQFAGRGATRGEDVGHEGMPNGEFVYGKFFPVDELADLDLAAEVTDVAVKSQALIDRLLQLGTGAEARPDTIDLLADFVERFRSERSYPTEADEQHRGERSEFAQLLAPDGLALADPPAIRRVWTTGRYGSPGPQSVLNATFRDALEDAEEYERILGTIRYVCWGEGDVADRIDEVLDRDGDRYVKGLGEAVIMKFLSICQPDRFVPIYPYAGPEGKLAMLTALELPVPDGSRGELQVRSNDEIRERLSRFFPGDPWGMMSFCYWYREQLLVPVEIDPLESRLDALADELLVEREFLDEIVELMRDKGQVIFYGPPGTGKTYLARKLAQALVPDITRRSLVQFHPSTSYEDFFEGYRPETTVDGEMMYRLTPGPLALLAERAAAAPGKRHLMIIDEINRANLPRVLGEMLFLLEYRDEQMPTLYRPDDPFKLPADLWFIGTMNTADRSIALVDAALRRRFHFVPFFPDSGPMSGLLDRWLKRNGEPLWVGELVAQVNDELVDRLGGPHLQLGASHFMKKGLDEKRLRQIWKYNIEPFIEDQFFGDADQIADFEFDAVLGRYLDGLGVKSVDQLRETDDGVIGVVPDAIEGDEPDDASEPPADS